MDIARLIEGRRLEDIVTCDESTVVRDAIQLLAGHRIGAMPVLSDGALAGIFSERDVVYAIAKEGASSLERKVSEIMTAPAITVASETTFDEVQALMTRRRIRHLPVVDNGQMIGFISNGDIVKSRIDTAEAEAAQMRVYIQSA